VNVVRLTDTSSAVENTFVPLVELFEPVREDLKRVEEEFTRHVQSQIGLIPTVGKYIQASGGKRIRPAVLLMASRLCGYTGDRAVLYAAVVEFIHTATLVHDDIIDDSELRRGRLAVHSQWGNDVSVLVGDFLYIKSMAMALTHDELGIIRLLCDVTLRMIEGEIYQLTKNGDADITEEEHFEIIRRKTAYLFGGCSQIGGMLAGVPTEQAEALGAYGFNLGIAFQVVDDLLDLTGKAEALGKPVASDLREGKLTLPVIHLMPKLAKPEQDVIRQVVRDREMSEETWGRISGWLAEHRCADSAYGRAVEFAKEAKRQLEIFPAGPERDALMALPEFVLSRDR
jgi:octaprenyl-diphosphate synthase